MTDIINFKQGTLKVSKKIADGAYGNTYRVSSTNGTEYAVKNFKTYRTTNFIGSIKELDFLSKLRHHPLILNLIGVSNAPKFLDNIEEEKDGEYTIDSINIVLEIAKYDATAFTKDYFSYDYLKLSFVQVLLGLEYLHGHGILHRDLKPTNLLWFGVGDKFGSDRIMKICDFGISKMYSKQDYNTPGVFTPIYRPPEVIYGSKEYNFVSDVWSLGCIFYEFIVQDSFVTLGDKKHNDALLLELIISKVSECPGSVLRKRLDNKC